MTSTWKELMTAVIAVAVLIFLCNAPRAHCMQTSAHHCNRRLIYAYWPQTSNWFVAKRSSFWCSSCNYAADDTLLCEGNRVFVGEFVLRVSSRTPKKKENKSLPYVCEYFILEIIIHSRRPDARAKKKGKKFVDGRCRGRIKVTFKWYC